MHSSDSYSWHGSGQLLRVFHAQSGENSREKLQDVVANSTGVCTCDEDRFPSSGTHTRMRGDVPKYLGRTLKRPTIQDEITKDHTFARANCHTRAKLYRPQSATFFDRPALRFQTVVYNRWLFFLFSSRVKFLE